MVAVLNSHEIVRRQLRYLDRLDLPDCVEIIFVDDGSDPPIVTLGRTPKHFHLLTTNDFRKWTQGLARMKGIEQAKGDYIFCTDIDHIVSREAIDFACKFDGDKAVFQRRFAYLDEDGKLVRDRDKVLEWGLLKEAIRDRHLSDGVHGNTWLMRKAAFEQLGGYDLKRCNSETHLQGEDRDFNKRWAIAQRAGIYKPQIPGPPIYFFPIGKYHKNGDENPHGLFHTLKKEKWDDR